ncbi:MAG: Cj0069 family protein [Ginsengibacter sp.]
MSSIPLAILVYGEHDSHRNALTEEKYKDLADALKLEGYAVESVLYNDSYAPRLAKDLLKFKAVLVWVNPVEQGMNRKRLDKMLTEISGYGFFVTTHPDVILKMGTKDVLFKTRNMDWGSDVEMYLTFEDFKDRFHLSLERSGIRVLKQHRGNGGNGIFKVTGSPSGDTVEVVHAKIALREEFSWPQLYQAFKTFFDNDGLLINQQWNDHLANGMVRCYLSGTKVAGFGYQEINAMYEVNNMPVPASKRYYFTENCGLFNDLKHVMENKWIPQLLEKLSVSADELPLIWDADFFINKTNTDQTAGKYTLCEINVSCVSPFPPSAIRFMILELNKTMYNKYAL